MFGYIVVNQPELKIKDYKTYRASYCGLCQSLKKRHGKLGQLTLSYDMTFLALLLTGLYEPKTEESCRRCLLHPFKKCYYRKNLYFDYAADVNIIFTYYKCLDDWKDDRKWSRLLAAKALQPKVKKIRKLYGKKVKKTERLLRRLSEYEKKNLYNIDKMSGFFGEIMAEWFVYRSDIWEDKLRRMGFFFGKFIYLMDAYEDIEEDRKKGRYNPLAKLYKKENFEIKCQQILKLMMAETSRTFEMLPILTDVEILRNILYAGVWTQYGQVQRRRKNSIHDNRSI